MATQIDPNPAPSLTGRRPTRMVLVTALVVGSMRDTVPWAALATHTAPSAASTSIGPAPTRMEAVTRPNEFGGWVTAICRAGPTTPIQTPSASAATITSAEAALVTRRRRSRRRSPSRPATGSTRLMLPSSARVDARPR